MSDQQQRRQHEGNGHVDASQAHAAIDGAPALAALREEPRNLHILRGFGPLAVGVLLLVLMVILAPSVAPERIVERPVGGGATEANEDGIVTTTSTAGTTSTTASVTTTAATTP
jgi:hypothetical protein